MRTLESISREETVVLLNKCWMTHDGMWFYHCLQELGIEATNKLNKAAIKSLAAVEIKRIKNMLGIDKAIENYDDFRMFFETASEFMIPDFMNVSFDYPEQNKMTWEFEKGKCFAYSGIKRIGVIDQYECGVLFRIKCWLEELKINHRFSPEIGQCHMHHSGYCSGDIQLFL